MKISQDKLNNLVSTLSTTLTLIENVNMETVDGLDDTNPYFVTGYAKSALRNVLKDLSTLS